MSEQTNPTTDAMTATRREVITLGLAARDANGSDEGTASGARSENRPQTIRGGLGAVLRIGLAVALVISVLVGSGGTGLVVADGASEPTAEDPQQAQTEAKALLEELHELDETPEVAIRSSQFASIEDNIKEGDLAQRNGRYGEAIDHYETASQQARAALKRGYVERASVLVAASEAHLDRLEAEGYDTAERQSLAVRADRLDERSRSVDDLEDARALESRALELHADVRTTAPRPAVVRVAGLLTSGLVVVPMLLLVSLGAALGLLYARRRRANGDRTSADVGVAAGHEWSDD